MSGGSPLARWGRFATRHGAVVLAVWAVALAGLGVAALLSGGRFVDNFELPGAESQKAVDLLEDRFPQQSGDSATLVFESNSGVEKQQTRDRIQRVLDRARDLPQVESVSSPYRSPGSISDDGDIAYATVQYAEPAAEVETDSVEELLDLADGDLANEGELRTEVGGLVISNSEVTPPGRAEIIGVGAAMVILLVAFGSVVAMGLPIITALAGLGAGVLLVVLGANFFDTTTFTPAFISMIGLGVGIDYALFIVTRYRELLSSGLSTAEAAGRATDTSGRAVIAAGTVVVISLLGLTTIGIPFVTALGLAAAVVVALAVAVGITLLPAILGLLGRNIDRWGIPGLRHTGGNANTLGARLSRVIQRAPLLYALGAMAVLIALAAPALDARLGFADDGTKPESFHSSRAYDLLAEGFGAGFNGPFLIALESRDGTLSRSTLQEITSDLAQTEGVDAVAPPQVNEANDTAVITLYPTTAPQAAATEDLADRLRENVIPRATGDKAVSAYLGGPTPSFIDIKERIADRMPYFLAFVIGLSFVLLMAVFRSIAVPVKAAALNLLSVGAALGVLVAVFQWGWGAELIGIPQTGPIEAFLPMMLFAILFGLSTDYEVFLVSRIREEYLKTGDNAASITGGLAGTARVITAAAAIMVSVFLSFVATDDRIIKEFGLGLAAAILIDATVIRLVLVPAAMSLLGRLNWAFPRWLESTLPNLNIEGGPTSSPSPARLALTGLTLAYLANTVESANGDYPRLTSAAAALVQNDQSSEHERASLAATTVLRPLALELMLEATRKDRSQ